MESDKLRKRRSILHLKLRKHDTTNANAVVLLSWVLLFAGSIDYDIFSLVNTSKFAIRANLFCVTIVFFLRWSRVRLNRTQSWLVIWAFSLGLWQIVGLFNHLNYYALTTILLSFLVSLYVCFSIGIDYSNVKTKVFKLLYYALFSFSLLDLYLNNGTLIEKYSVGPNSMGGMLIFLAITNVVLINKNSRLRRVDYVALFLTIPLLLFSRARTSAAVAIIITVVFLLLSLLRLKRRSVLLLYWVIIFGSILGMYFYSQIVTYSFYPAWNAFSLQLFGKHIDSSRPWLWKSSLDYLGKNWVLGLGTGILPDDLIAFEGSFHNQFLQLLMQNGIVGLGIFYCFLFTLWIPLARHLDDRVIRICASAFIGIIIYNCFETTLLQNKMALGIMQWQIISIGVSRGLALDQCPCVVDEHRQ